MQDVFIGRQPIYNSKLDLVAYELLFRSGSENCASVIDGDSATGQVLLNTLVEIGLDNLVGERLAYINFTRRFLTDQDSLPFDKDRIVVEILETIEPDEEFIAAVRKVSQSGFKIVLDDFVFAEKFRGLVELADTVKLDIQALDRKQLKVQVQTLRECGIKQLLAEKIETHDEFEYCRELGFNLFQGYFLSRPQIVRGKVIPNNHLAALQLLAKLQNPDVGFKELERIIATDVSLSYKILHYLNSAAIGLPRKIESIRQAITLLGLQRLRMMVTLITLTGISNRPRAIMNIAVTRAKMCELLARMLKRKDFDSFTVVGLFSTLDVLLDSTMADVLKPLPLTDEVKEALLSCKGVMGEVYRCALAAERSNWDTARCVGLSQKQIQEAYLQALAAIESDPVIVEQLRSSTAIAA